MKRRTPITIILLILGFLLIVSCKEEKQPKTGPEGLDWILGKWKLEDNEVIEEWKKDREKYSGISYVMDGQDTIVFEYIRMELIRDTLHYIPTVLNQNDGKPIYFKQENEGYKHLRFSNPDHDFPQLIEYKLNGNDTIHVTLEGLPDKKSSFNLIRNG